MYYREIFFAIIKFTHKREMYISEFVEDAQTESVFDARPLKCTERTVQFSFLNSETRSPARSNPQSAYRRTFRTCRASRPCPWLPLAWAKKIERFRAWSIIGDPLMRESQGEDEGVLEVHAWTEHASALASGTRLIRRTAHARNRKPHVYLFRLLFLPLFLASLPSAWRGKNSRFRDA